jgi:hypothetical protein
MYGPTIDTTFGFIAARAARYPVIMRRSQMRKAVRRAIGPRETGDQALRWLLLNTRATNRFLKGTGLRASDA